MLPEKPALSRSLGTAIFIVFAAAFGAFALFSQSTTTAQRSVELDVPYVPTPQEVVDKMLELAAPKPDDYLIDLGSGDGRIPVTAAARYGTPGMGVDLNPVRVSEAKEKARENGVAGKVEFHERDLFKTDISRASVLTMYLLSSVNMQLRPRILSELKPGTRVVSHSFDMGDWEPDRTEEVGSRTVHYWVVPARVDGSWVLTDKNRPGNTMKLEITQKFQKLDGKVAEGAMTVENATVSGDRVQFDIAGNGERKTYQGRFVDGKLTGDGWEAERSS